MFLQVKSYYRYIYFNEVFLFSTFIFLRIKISFQVILIDIDLANSVTMIGVCDMSPVSLLKQHKELKANKLDNFNKFLNFSMSGVTLKNSVVYLIFDF